ncbi:hypothetical protein GCM10009834_13300 [Streptomonospora arabica]
MVGDAEPAAQGGRALVDHQVVAAAVGGDGDPQPVHHHGPASASASASAPSVDHGDRSSMLVRNRQAFAMSAAPSSSQNGGGRTRPPVPSCRSSDSRSGSGKAEPTASSAAAMPARSAGGASAANVTGACAAGQVSMRSQDSPTGRAWSTDDSMLRSVAGGADILRRSERRPAGRRRRAPAS